MRAKSNADGDYDGTAPRRFLRLQAVLERVGVSSASIRRWEEKGTFPRRRRLGLNSVAWVEHEIDQWCAERASES
jgi:prophage regulatory protein